MSQIHQLLANRYPADLQEFLGAAPRKVAIIYLLAGNLEGGAEWDFAIVTGGPGLSILSGIHGDYRRPFEASWVARESVPLSIEDLLAVA